MFTLFGETLPINLTLSPWRQSHLNPRAAAGRAVCFQLSTRACLVLRQLTFALQFLLDGFGAYNLLSWVKDYTAKAALNLFYPSC